MFSLSPGTPAPAPSEAKSNCWDYVDEFRLLLGDGLTVLQHSNVLPAPAQPGGASLGAPPEGESSELQQALRSLQQQRRAAEDVHRLRAFRQAALQALWAHRRAAAAKTAAQPAAAQRGAEVAAVPGDSLAFASHLSLLLLLPLLESQSRTDLRLCAQSSHILAGFLNRFQPLSLQRENPECVDGLRRLLRGWLSVKQSELAAAGVDMSQLASGLVALTAARGSLADFVDTLDLLLRLTDLPATFAQAPAVQSLLTATSEAPVLLAAAQHRSAWDVRLPTSTTPGPDSTRLYQHPLHEHPMRLSPRTSSWICNGPGCGYRSAKVSQSRVACFFFFFFFFF